MPIRKKVRRRKRRKIIISEYQKNSVREARQVLTSEQVLEIRKHLYIGVLSLRKIADLYNTSAATIMRIKNGITYKNIQLERKYAIIDK